MTTANISIDNQRDILELQQKIEDFKGGKIDEEKFKHFRLTRGVYGQRQQGVHMFRTKIPLGRLTSQQLHRLAAVSHKYATGNLHLTTRQNVQFHYVKLNDSTKVWKELASVDINAREACGNTVRNITASANAGIDPHEPFDVSPYAIALYDYFLRNPICQEMGRKIKIAFSSSQFDTAFTYFHDFGFIPKIQNGQRGFKLVIAGGLGAQAIVAQTAFDFISADKIIPFTEATLRVFDRYGEREKRFKARMKYLLKALGIEQFKTIINEELKGVSNQSIPIDATTWKEPLIPKYSAAWQSSKVEDAISFRRWKNTNTTPQKQKGYFSVGIKIRLGDIGYLKAQKLSEVVRLYAADDIRITVNQGFILRFVHSDALKPLYNELSKIDLADPGFSSIADITACPGTDTCNLAVTNSTQLSEALENTIINEYPDLLYNKDLQIKISGCMNSCGQHMAAQIGFHGSSFKVNNLVAPAQQVVLGGGIEPNGKTFIGEKVIKLPTKRMLEALRIILNEYLDHFNDNETFNSFYYRVGKAHFYELLKPLGDKETLTDEDFQDWGEQADYVQAIGVGECAGAAIDVVATILDDAHERLDKSVTALGSSEWDASIYNSYSALVISAKALLLADDIACNTHAKIIDDFQKHYVDENRTNTITAFKKTVLKMKDQKPTAEFARQYYNTALEWYEELKTIRANQINHNGQDKIVVAQHYNA